MGKRSDHKKLDELAAWDMDKGCRGIVNQSTPARRKLKKRLSRQARKRVNKQTLAHFWAKEILPTDNCTFDR